jgi:hypothetical protein
LLTHPHHITTIRSSVTRNLGVKFEDIRDEVVESFKTYIPLTSEGPSCNKDDDYAKFMQVGPLSPVMRPSYTSFAALLTDTLLAFLCVSRRSLTS